MKILLLITLCLEDVFKSVDICSLQMPLFISKMACMHIEDNKRSVFIVPPSKGTNHWLYSAKPRLGPRHPGNQMTTWNPHNFFITPVTNRMMKRMDTTWIVEMVWISVKGGTSLWNLSYQKENQPTITITHTGGWDISLRPPSQNQSLTSPYHHNYQTRPVGTLILVWE